MAGPVGTWWDFQSGASIVLPGSDLGDVDHVEGVWRLDVPALEFQGMPVFFFSWFVSKKFLGLHLGFSLPNFSVTSRRREPCAVRVGQRRCRLRTLPICFPFVALRGYALESRDVCGEWMPVDGVPLPPLRLKPANQRLAPSSICLF